MKTSIFKTIFLASTATVMLSLTGCGSSGTPSDDTLVGAVSPDVHVKDQTPPVITLNGQPAMAIYQGTVFTDPGATATDNVDTTVHITVTGTVNTSVPGTYYLTYSALDTAGNKAHVTRTVHVVHPAKPLPTDLVPPVITLNGQPSITIFVGAVFTDPGASALDAVDGTVPVTTPDTVNTTQTGVYHIHYTAVDKTGNKATAVRTVHVVSHTLPLATPDTTKPVIRLLGANPLTINGVKFKDPGATAKDDRDGDITSAIVTKDDVNTSKEGDYTITYTVSDKAGNKATATRKVKVVFAQMNEAQAKEAMVMNAVIYPLLVPLSNIAHTYLDFASPTTLHLLLSNFMSIPAATKELQPGVYECTPGYPQYGHFTYLNDSGGMAVKFDNCKDYGNQWKIHENIVISGCIVGKAADSSPLNPAPIGTYRVEYSGTVFCTEDLKLADKYSYRTIGNGNSKKKMEWTYDGVALLDIEPGKAVVAGEGSVESLAKYTKTGQDATTPWNDLFLGSDEEWRVSNGLVVLEKDKKPDTEIIAADGNFTYIKHKNDNQPPKGDPSSFNMYFERLVYEMTHNPDNIETNLVGKVSSSCHPELITYATTSLMKDLDVMQDINGSRMPSNGAMTMAIPGYKPAPAVFNAGGSTAEVKITSSAGDKTYGGWEEIINGSNCTELKNKIAFIMGVITTPGELNPRNLVFYKPGSVVATPTHLEGLTDGHAVWYYQPVGSGYNKGQTVGQTFFDFDATFAAGTPYVNVYLHDPNGKSWLSFLGVKGKNEKKTIYKNQDWLDLQAAHPGWIIRTDYTEYGNGKVMHGNFFVRFGGSNYTGHDDKFIINTFNIHK